MSKRTYGQMIADVQRALGHADISLGEIAQAIQTAYKDVDAKYEWPWCYGDTNVLVMPVKNQGTISVIPGDINIYGVGTEFMAVDLPPIGYPTMDDSWRIRASGRTGEWKVKTVTSPTLLELEQYPNLPASLLNVTYVAWKDEYDMPSDFQPGEQLLLYHQETRVPIPYVPMSSLESATMAFKTASSVVPIAYSDVGNGRIRFVPVISSRSELRLRYKKIATDFSSLSATSLLPEGHDELVALTAEAKLRQVNGLPDNNATGRAITKFQALMRLVATSDMKTDGAELHAMPDSSISQMGLSILPYEEG